MRTAYLAILLSFLGFMYLDPSLAQDPPEGEQPAPQEIQTQPQPTEQEAGTNEPTPGESPAGTTGTPTEEVAEDYKQFEEYIALQAALQQGDWQLADQKTYELMLKIAGTNSQQQGFFVAEDWETFSCSALRDINQLWMQASNGQQGFSRQWEIFKATRPNDRSYYYKIGWSELSGTWKVAWRLSNNRLVYTASPDFSNDAPPGHLPAGLEWEDGQDRRFQAINRCEL